MPRTPSRSLIAAALAIAVIVVLAAMASGALGRTPTPSPVPSTPPSAQPTVVPTPVPSPVPSDVADGPIVVDLDTADANDVSVEIDDATGVVVKATTGRARDGMSVRWGEIDVQNVDADTLKLTWSGWPMDEVIDLDITADGDGYALAFSQKLPYPNTDAMGADRVLVLDFDHAVDAADISASFSPAA
ncbi:MAG: hypothetical protein ACXW4T_04070 [Candidatus Limnocylindrales bacterium]